MAFSSGASAGNVESSINVVPLIDVLLVLLIIFMVTAPLMSHKTKVELPKVHFITTETEAPPVPPITVAVTSDGQFFWNDQPVTRDRMDSEFAVAAQQTPQPSLNVRGDELTKYRAIDEVVQSAQAAGMRKVGFIAERRR